MFSGGCFFCALCFFLERRRFSSHRILQHSGMVTAVLSDDANIAGQI